MSDFSLMNTTGGAFKVLSMRINKLAANVMSAVRLDRGANR